MRTASTEAFHRRIEPGSAPGRIVPPAAIAGPITLMPRTLAPPVSEALDAVPAGRLPAFRLDSPLSGLAETVEGALVTWASEPGWLAPWLAADIAALGKLYADLTRATHLSVRLEAVSDDGCSRFHTDLVRFRLVSTYRGPGTQWIDPRAANLHGAGERAPSKAIRQLGRGAVAIIRGTRDAAPDQPGLLHRSPPAGKNGQTRLFLAIDDFSDHAYRS